MVTREEFLERKVQQLIQDNLELSSRLEYDYDPEKPVRKLTLQEKLEINMGNSLKKFRIKTSDFKQIYGNIIMAIKEPEYVDLTFNDERMYTASYFVDSAKEAIEIQKGEDVNVDITKIEDLPLQQKYDMEKVLNELTDTTKPS
jgi:hypothetical protein